MPELTFDTQEAVPEPFRPNAQAKDGKFVIDVIPATDLKEFRDRNIELSRTRDDLQSWKARVQADLGLDDEGYDQFITSFNELKSTKQRVDDGELIANTSLEDALKARTSEMQRTHEHEQNALKNRNRALEEENKTVKASLARAQVDKEFITAIGNPKSGALPEATDTILMFAYDVFRPNEDGNLVGYDRENKVLYGADGSTPMTPLEWLGKLREEKSFLFKRSEGGGSQGSQGRHGMTAADIMKLDPVERMNRSRQQ